MRAVWVDSGNDPDYAKLARYGITVPFFDPRDPRVTAQYLDAVAAHPNIDTCGIYTAWNWQSWTGPQYAEWTDQQLRRIGWMGNAIVCLNIENHDINGYVIPALRRWRQLRPSRKTWWTLEGMQGGLFSGNQPSTVNALNIILAPQFYEGNMTPHRHSPVIDLEEPGFALIDGMYDAAVLPSIWRGFAFTQGRLP